MEHTEKEQQILRSLGERIRQDLIDLYPPEEDGYGEVLFRLEDGSYRFFDERFCGACAVASYMLKQAAKRLYGIRLTLVACPIHTWCETSDGTVIDITYSQFDSSSGGDTPIWIGEHQKDHRMFDGELFENSAAENYISEEWENQSPFDSYHFDKIQAWLRNISLEKKKMMREKNLAA